MATTFVSLAPELKSIIFDNLFADTASSRPLDILTRRVPAEMAIRATCKQLYAESAYSFKVAEKANTAKRNAIVKRMTEDYKKIQTGIPVVITSNICLLAATLDKLTCHHACAKDSCYMCDDPAHRACFNCGKNLAEALWCRLPKEARDQDDQAARPTPKLVVPTTSSSIPALVNGIRSNLTTQGREMAHFQRPFLPTPDYFGNKPWAWRWWMNELLTQQTIDVRCAIRRKSVNEYWQDPRWPRFHAFAEPALKMIDSWDPRQGFIFRAEMAMGKIERMGEYAERAERESKEKGLEIGRLVPKADRKK